MAGNGASRSTSESLNPEILRSLETTLDAWPSVKVEQCLKSAREEHSEFLSRFPMDDWPSLTIEHYALGPPTYRESFSWWLEWGTKSVGSIRGGSASKHIIYLRHDNTWHIPSRYKTVDEAWDSVRAGFVDMLQFAADGDFEEAFNVPALDGATVVRMKTLFLYFPNELLPIFARAHLEHFLRALGTEPSGEDALEMNRQLLRTIRSVPQLADFSTQELAYLLYAWSHPDRTISSYKIAPGEQGSDFDDCLAGGFICVGWDDVGDLKQFGSKEDFVEEFRLKYPYEGNASQVTKKSAEIWTLMELEPGDRIIANKGTSEILAIGTVNDVGYVWRPERTHSKHTVGVDWDTTFAKKIQPKKPWAFVTVAKVSSTVFRELTDGAGPQQADASILNLYRDLEEAVHRRGQVILYGPPGTGKTYSARRAATWLLKGGSTSADANGLLANDSKFEAEELASSSIGISTGRVWWMVSNPRQWSWDELFESGSVQFSLGRLRRNFPEVRAGDLVVGYAANPLKRVVALARVVGEYDIDEPPEEAIDLEQVAQIEDGLTYAELVGDPLLSKSEPARFRCQGTLFALTQAESDHLLRILGTRDPSITAKVSPSIQQLTQITFHPSYSYEDFVEGFRPQETNTGSLDLRLTDGIFKRVCKAAAADPDRHYVVMIDEINRGNIPKIFGELITLLDKDKRGRLSITLAQSGERFTVPPNLIILGTMNTADRSIQLLDMALRRRFAFIEVLPEPAVLEGATAGDLQLDVFLKELNTSLLAYDRERQIGHAVFFFDHKVVNTPEEVASIFRHEILPLLQEYLFDDYRQLAELLGENLIDVERQRPSALLADPEALCAELSNRFNTTSRS